MEVKYPGFTIGFLCMNCSMARTFGRGFVAGAGDSFVGMVAFAVTGDPVLAGEISCIDRHDHYSIGTCIVNNAGSVVRSRCSKSVFERAAEIWLVSGLLRVNCCLLYTSPSPRDS